MTDKHKEINNFIEDSLRNDKEFMMAYDFFKMGGPGLTSAFEKELEKFRIENKISTNELYNLTSNKPIMNQEEKSTMNYKQASAQLYDPSYEADTSKPVLKPHEDYDFVNHDKVFVENQDGTKDYFELYYEQEVSCWIMVSYTDSTYVDVKTENDGTTVKAESMSTYGYDVVKRFVDYE